MGKVVHNLTQAALDNIKKEHHHLVHIERVKVIQEIQEARSLGDLSENADYDAAKNQQSFVEGRIAELQEILDNHVLIDSSAETFTVSVGNTVRILDMSDNQEYDYQILGAIDSDPKNSKISNDCPLAKSILGKKVGDVAEVMGIDDHYKVKVLKIS